MPNKTNCSDSNKIAEEKFREAACYGDDEAVRKLVERGVNISSQHDINGWSALHWAAKRGHSSIVSYLLKHGADKTLTSLRGETPFMLAENEEIRKMLGDSSQGSGDSPNSPKGLPITPHYLSHPPLGYKVDVGDGCPNEQSPEIGHHSSEDNTSQDELVVKVRVAQSSDPDFIEVDIPRTQLTFSKLLQTCCEELQVDSKKVAKLRKLPNTVLRKDKDVSRLNDFQELEVVLQSIQPAKSPPQTSCKVLSQKPSPSQPIGNITTSTSPVPPGYLSTRHTAPPSRNLLEKSNYYNNQPSLEESEEGNFIWEDASINCLINCYRDAAPCFDSPRLNKEVWVTVSEGMQSKGYNVTELQCKNKWKSLPSVFDGNEHNDFKIQQNKKNKQNTEENSNTAETLAVVGSSDCELHIQSMCTTDLTSEPETAGSSSDSELHIDSAYPTETAPELEGTIIKNTNGPHMHSICTTETTSKAVVNGGNGEYVDSSHASETSTGADTTSQLKAIENRSGRPHIHSIHITETTPGEMPTDSSGEDPHIQSICVTETTHEVLATDSNRRNMHIQPIDAETIPKSIVTDKKNGRPHIHSIYVAETTPEPVTTDDNNNNGRPHIHSLYIGETNPEDATTTDCNSGALNVQSIYVAKTTSESEPVGNRSERPHIQSICTAQTAVGNDNKKLQHVQAVYVAEAPKEPTAANSSDGGIHVASIYATETTTEPVTNSNELHIQSVYTLEGPSLLLHTSSLSPQPVLESSITIQTEGGDSETNLQDVQKIKMQPKGMKRKKQVTESHLKLLEERENAKERCHKMKLEAMQKSNELLEKLLAAFETD